MSEARKSPWKQNVAPCPLCDSDQVAAIPIGKRIIGQCYNCGYSSGIAAWNKICAALEWRLKVKKEKRLLKLRQSRTPAHVFGYLEQAMTAMRKNDL